MKKILLILVFVLGLLYMIVPGPSTRGEIPPLPNSVKSNEPGDTTQNPNNAGYYSDYHRDFITRFYRNAFKNLDFMGKLFPPMILNHPPEDAFTYVRDQEKSTFLEEYTYPLRESLFVNGYEPLLKNGRSISPDADHVEHGGILYNSKTVVRIYSSNIILRLVIYLLIWESLILFFKISKKIFAGGF